MLRDFMLKHVWQLKNFTGIDSPYEVPENPEIWIDTTRMDIDEAADEIIRLCL